MSSSIAMHAPEWELESGVVARPDVLVVSVAARVDGVQPSAAVRALREATATLHARVVATCASATLVAGKLRLADTTPDKLGKMEGPATLDGAILAPLADDLDHWSRAALAADIVETVLTVAAELRKAKPPVVIAYRAPVAKVRDTTAHRATLATRLNAHLRAMLDGVSGATFGASWDVPVEVEQQTISLDEVRLSLTPRARRSTAHG